LENYEENAKEKCNLPQITALDVDFEFLSRERGHKNLIKFPFQNEIVKQFIAGKGGEEILGGKSFTILSSWSFQLKLVNLQVKSFRFSLVRIGKEGWFDVEECKGRWDLDGSNANGRNRRKSPSLS
jgi:hypothetical protein